MLRRIRLALFVRRGNALVALLMLTLAGFTLTGCGCDYLGPSNSVCLLDELDEPVTDKGLPPVDSTRHRQ